MCEQINKYSQDSNCSKNNKPIAELPFLNEKEHTQTLSIAIPYMRSYKNAISDKGINVAGCIGMFDGAFRELFFIMSNFEERINDLEQAYLNQKLVIDELKSKLDKNSIENN